MKSIAKDLKHTSFSDIGTLKKLVVMEGQYLQGNCQEPSKMLQTPAKIVHCNVNELCIIKSLKPRHWAVAQKKEEKELICRQNIRGSTNLQMAKSILSSLICHGCFKINIEKVGKVPACKNYTIWSKTLWTLITIITK